MQLTGLHLLLTYQCTFQCDHCFVWGSPWKTGVMTIEQLHEILTQASKLDSLEWIYFEGGEPFLYYPVLMRGVQMATAMGFHVGIVSNAYWATTLPDALVWLKPFADLIEELTISSDRYHSRDTDAPEVRNAGAAARELGIPFGTISVEQPDDTSGEAPALMYRGRASCELVARASLHSWHHFTACAHEDLRDPGRCHLDPFGNVHICQGISIGNVFKRPLLEICTEYHAESHPVCGPLLRGGPVELVAQYDLAHASKYADACHLCYEARLALRERFPEILTPDQMYGD